MKFGKVDNPAIVDFAIPSDHKGTAKILDKQNRDKFLAYVGCAKWNRQDLKKFYPRGTKDELEYYSSQFNGIELNATFYRLYPADQFAKWYEKTPDGFRFFPKLSQEISHFRRLNEQANTSVETFISSASNLKEKLGSIFLQMPSNFGPKYFDRVQTFVERWPTHLRLAIELRHKGWFADKVIANDLYSLLEDNNIANVLVDTAGRRDLMHMRLTNDEAFIRYVGANEERDYARLDDWINRIKSWRRQGLNRLHFFVHQNEERESPLLATHFIKRFNAELDQKLTIPNSQEVNPQSELF